MSRKPAGLAVDQVLAFAAAVDAAGDVDLGGVDGQQAGGVVERERDLGGVHRPAAAGAVEDDVGHLRAAEALDALLAEHPLDRVDDVRLARSVRPDDDRDAGGEFEPGLVGEALETDKFQRLEHDGRFQTSWTRKVAISGQTWLDSQEFSNSAPSRSGLASVQQFSGLTLRAG